jgi:hypothetical protein
MTQASFRTARDASPIDRVGRRKAPSKRRAARVPRFDRRSC